MELLLRQVCRRNGDGLAEVWAVNSEEWLGNMAGFTLLRRWLNWVQLIIGDEEVGAGWTELVLWFTKIGLKFGRI